MRGTLVFAGRDGNGCELCTSDGVRADLLADINSGPASSMWPLFTSTLREVGGLVLFSADDGVHGLETWATDGTSTIRLVQDIAEGAGWSSPHCLTPVGRLVFFAADDHLVGPELWAMPTSALPERLRLAEITAVHDAGDEPRPARRAPAD